MRSKDLFKFLLPFVLGVNVIHSVQPSSKIDPELESRIGETGEPVDIVIFLENPPDESRNISMFTTYQIPKAEDPRILRCNIIKQIFKHLLDIHEKAKQNLVKRMAKLEVVYYCYWANNLCVAYGVTPETIAVISTIPGVDYVAENVIFEIPQDSTQSNPPDTKGQCNGGVSIDQQKTQWSVARVKAEEMWKKGLRGEGITIGILDSGVYGVHDALKGKNRRTHYWYDPISHSQYPYDCDYRHSHGTAAAGCAVGGNGIGTAPGALWVACRIFANSENRADINTISACLQWSLCPTEYDGKNRDCCMAPDVINLSFGVYNEIGKKTSKRAYEGLLWYFQQARIIPVVAIGNHGDEKPYCETTGYPGTSPYVVSVGATNKTEKYAFFSSCGPDEDKKIQPYICAPGKDITTAAFRGSYEADHDCYAVISGTSFSCPYTAGGVALLLQAYYSLHLEHIKKLLKAGARQLTTWNAADFQYPLCKDERFSKGEFPNNIYGFGELDIEKSFNKVAEGILNK